MSNKNPLKVLVRVQFAIWSRVGNIYTAFTLAKKWAGTARLFCQCKRVLQCCAMPCHAGWHALRKCADTARHSTASFTSANASDPKWAVLAGKNLHLVPSSLSSFEDFVQKAMTAVWNDTETFKLVEIWGEEEIQALLEGCMRNKGMCKIDCLCRNLEQRRCACCRLLCSELWEELENDSKREEELAKSDTVTVLKVAIISNDSIKSRHYIEWLRPPPHLFFNCKHALALLSLLQCKRRHLAWHRRHAVPSRARFCPV